MSGTVPPLARDMALAASLDAIGVRCSVEAHGRLALLHCADAAKLSDMELRDRVHAAALECGFTHVALELLGTGADAAIRGT